MTAVPKQICLKHIYTVARTLSSQHKHISNNRRLPPSPAHARTQRERERERERELGQPPPPPPPKNPKTKQNKTKKKATKKPPPKQKQTSKQTKNPVFSVLLVSGMRHVVRTQPSVPVAKAKNNDYTACCFWQFSGRKNPKSRHTSLAPPFTSPPPPSLPPVN